MDDAWIEKERSFPMAEGHMWESTLAVRALPNWREVRLPNVTMARDYFRCHCPNHTPTAVQWLDLGQQGWQG